MRRVEDRSAEPASCNGSHAVLTQQTTTNHLDEIYEHVPMRTSSLRHWSLSSTTPTIASSGVNSSQPPPSNHTPNTSVDIALTSDMVASSQASLASGQPKPRSYAATIEDQLWGPPTATVRQDSTFNIDDYVSSDSDSFDGDFGNSGLSARTPTREAENGLLWRDSGYGASGFQLPGLFDSITEVLSSTPSMSDSPRQMTGPSLIRHYEGLFPGDSDSDDDRLPDSVPPEFHGGRKGQTMVPEQSIRRIHTFGIPEPPAEPELSTIKVRNAVRLRKETKAKMRIKTESQGANQL